MKRAWLYCTELAGAPMFVGEVQDEGSLRDHIKAHTKRYGDEHAKAIHLLVEGTPQHDEVKDWDGFPYLTALLHDEALDPPEWVR